jgi:hypothetical protein
MASMTLPVSRERTMRREDIVSWLRRRRIILLYSIRLFTEKFDEAGDDERQMNKYAFLKRRSIQFLDEMNDRIDKAFELKSIKYLVNAYVAETVSKEEGNPYNESFEAREMKRNQVAKYVGDMRSILYEVRQSGHFKNPSYTREIQYWQTETKKVKVYVLDNFDENALVVYDHTMHATS